MKNMIQKAIVTFVVALTVTSCMVITAFAATPKTSTLTPSPYWSHWVTIAASLDIEKDNWAECGVMADCSSREADNIKVTCELQQLNGSWKTIKSWTESEKNDTTLLMTKYYAVAKNYSYRLKITAKAYKGTSLLETVTSYCDYGYYQ